MPVSGTVTSSGNFRTGNLGGFSGWGVFNAASLACDNTFCYCLFPNVTNSNIGAGVPNNHLVKIPWANFDVAHATILASFTEGSPGSSSALAIRPSDGVLACRTAAGNLYTFDPNASYTANLLGAAGGGAPTALNLLGIAFDPTDSTVLWSIGYTGIFAKWKIGTGSLAAPAYTQPTYSLQPALNGQFIGAAAWDLANSPKGVIVFDPTSGLSKCPLGLRWLSTDTTGAANGDHTQNTLASRATVSKVIDACMDKDGLIYVANANGGTSASLRRVTADWTSSDAISTAGPGSTANAHVAVSPDATKVTFSQGEQVYKVT